MKEKKLISVRLDADIVAKLDQFAKEKRYWKRSAVINNILEAVITRAGTRDFDMIARFPAFRGQILKISVNDSSM